MPIMDDLLETLAGFTFRTQIKLVPLVVIWWFLVIDVFGKPH